MKNQKEGVFGVIQALLAERGATIEGKVELSKEDKAFVVREVAAAMANGEIELSAEAKAKYPTAEALQKYVPGLVSNWLRKDTRLNGGTKYEIKSPGSRTGDVQLTEMRKLLKTNLTDEQRAAVQAKIDERITELRAQKTQTIEINYDAIPESLRQVLGQ